MMTTFLIHQSANEDAPSCVSGGDERYSSGAVEFDSRRLWYFIVGGEPMVGLGRANRRRKTRTKE